MSARKAFLCSIDGTFNFPLLPKVTTIGRENCDIVINSQNIDSQHAVIECVENENCFIIQDLNTVNGTYINDCRVQNAAVRLAEHDVVRFGFNGLPFHFIIQEQLQTSIPPINLPRQSSNQQLQFINQTIPSRGTQFQSNNQANGSVWINIPATNAQLITSNQSLSKPPASLRMRPGSASNLKKVTQFAPQPQLNGWVKGGQYNNNGLLSQSEVELNKVSSSNDSELHNKLYQLEKEMKMKNVEIKDLTDKLNSLQSQQNSITGSQQTQEYTLRNELEQTKRDKSIATGLINTMQKDLTTKDATISKLAREIENLKKETRERDAMNRDLTDRLNSLKDFKKAEEERQNKEKELLVLKNKIRSTENKVVDLNNHVLQIKSELEDSQRQLLKNTQSEKNLKDELEHVKIQYLDMQRAERTVRIDLEQSRRMYEKFRNLIIQTLYATPGIGQPSGEVTDDDLVATWKKLIDEKSKLKEKIDGFKDKLKTSEEYHTETIESIKNLENQLNKIQSCIYKNNGRRTDDVTVSVNELVTMGLHDNLVKLREPMVEIFRNELKWHTDIEETLKSFEIDTSNNYAFTVLMKSMQDKYASLDERRVAVQKQLEEAEASHAERIDKLIIEKQSEIESQLELCRSELLEKHSAEIDKLNKEHEEKLSSLLANSQMGQDELAQECNSVKGQLIEANAQISSLTESLTVSNSTITLLKSQLSEKEEEYNAKIADYESHKVEVSLKYSTDLEIYKEQIRQHSLTIVGLEKDLGRARDREIDCLNQIEAIKKKFAEREPIKPSPPPQKLTPPPTPPKIDSDILALEKTIENLRHECSSYSRKISEQDEVIRVLRKDLISANAKLTDVHSEISDKQKREMEKNRAVIHEQTRELADTRSQLARLSEIVDNQARQIDSLKAESGKSRALAEKYKLSAEENGNLVLELKAKLDSGTMQLKKIETIRHEEGKITTELTAIGAQCRGERHEQVISRQREALNELRQRVKTLEQSRPLLPAAQQQQQQQIMLLKKQLAEFRANQALTEDIAKQANLSRGDDNLLMLEEKTAHHDTQSALDYSEETYLNLLRSIASMLDMTEVDGLKPMMNLPPDERDRLLNERNRSIEVICLRLRDMKESLLRKEKLLQDYELDLAKLRQAEFLLQKKAEQLDEAQLSSRNKDDELQLLKESLRNSRYQLDQEKQVNTTIKQKKPLSSLSMSTDRIRKNSTDTLHHHCPPDSEAKVKDVKRTMNDKIKKKDYELKVLKQELRSKHDELNEISNRLKIHDNGQDLFS